MKDMDVAIQGMHCQACVRRVEKALAGVEGARVIKVEIGSAAVDVDPSLEQAALDAIQNAGYAPSRME